MSFTKSYKIGWAMTVLLSVFLIFVSAGGKFREWEGKAEMFEKLGYTADLMFSIGILEVALALLILVPRASFIGALLLTAYLGGATATHVRVGDPFIFPVIVGLFLWIALALRMPEIQALVLGKRS